MKDLPQGESVQIVKKSTKLSMFDIYAKPINDRNGDMSKSVIKLEWNVVEYGGEGKPSKSNAHGNMNFDTATKIAKDILDGHPLAAKTVAMQQLEMDLGNIFSNLSSRIVDEEDKRLLADQKVKRLMIERSLSSAIEKAYLQPNRIRETWTRKQDKNGTYYQVMISGGGKGKTMIESRYISIEAREYNGKLQYHVSAGVTEGIRGSNGEVLPKDGAPVTRAKTIVNASDMCEAMEKLLLFIQGSVTCEVGKGSYRPFTINKYEGNGQGNNQGYDQGNNQGYDQRSDQGNSQRNNQGYHQGNGQNKSQNGYNRQYDPYQHSAS